MILKQYYYLFYFREPDVESPTKKAKKKKDIKHESPIKEDVKTSAKKNKKHKKTKSNANTNDTESSITLSPVSPDLSVLNLKKPKKKKKKKVKSTESESSVNIAHSPEKVKKTKNISAGLGEEKHHTSTKPDVTMVTPGTSPKQSNISKEGDENISEGSLDKMGKKKKSAGKQEEMRLTRKFPEEDPDSDEDVATKGKLNRKEQKKRMKLEKEKAPRTVFVGNLPNTTDKKVYISVIKWRYGYK